MADAPDRPAGTVPESTSEPGGNLGTMPALPPTDVYRPLSLLALVAFGVAALFAAILAIAALVSLFRQAPLLMPGAIFVVPAAAAVLSLVARNRIRNSEGALSGASLASWGLGLSLASGLLYAAYIAATFFAVRQQATELADRWLDEIKQGKLESAFLLTIAPASRPPQDANLRDALEVEYGGDKPAGIPWSGFRRSDLVHLLQGGDQVHIHAPVITSWPYDKGAYTVDLRYQVDGPEASATLVVTVLGTEPAPGDSSGRQWHVKTFHVEGIKPTEIGQQRNELTQSGRSFVDMWQKAFEMGESMAYMGTVLPAVRESTARAMAKMDAAAFPALSGTAALATVDDRTRETMVGLHAYMGGALVHADAKKFWALPRSRSPIEEAVRRMFCPGPDHRMGRVQIPQRAVPELEDKGGTTRLAMPVSIGLMAAHEHRPQYMVEAEVVLERSAAPGAVPSPQDWRVVAIDLVSGRSMSGQGGPARGGLPPQ